MIRCKVDEVFDKKDYLHVDLTVLDLDVAGRKGSLKFKVFAMAGSSGLEFRAGNGWPNMFAEWPGEVQDAYGPVFKLTTGPALPAALERLCRSDRAFVAALAELLPEIVHSAVQAPGFPTTVKPRIADAAQALRDEFGSVEVRHDRRPKRRTAATTSGDRVALSSGTGTRPDIFIVGCGRSGTSLAAGLFRNAGFFMGEELHPPRPSNPKGFFEDATVNRLNGAIVARLLPPRTGVAPPGYGCDVPDRQHTWLARVPLGERGMVTADELETMRSLAARKPFCFKDPRFCYTLDLWRPFAERAKFICVFRDPAEFVSSVFTECLATPTLHGFAISVAQLFDVWVCMYSHVLRRHCGIGDWLFVEYADLVGGTDIDRVRSFTGIEIDDAFADASLKRSRAEVEVPPAAAKLLEELRAQKAA